MNAKVITGNDLLTGDVIFLHQDGKNWTRQLNQAWNSDSESQIEQMLNLANRQHTVIGAEAVAAQHDENQLSLAKFREHIRSQGPSVRTDLGKQAEFQRAA